MCKKKKACQNPRALGGKPQECSAEQINKCHEDTRGHPCLAPAKSENFPDASDGQGHVDRRLHPSSAGRAVGILAQVREKMLCLCIDRDVDRSRRVSVYPLSPNEAIGAKADADFAIKKGKERVIEATFEGARGQAFTDAPSDWTGTLDELLSLDLSIVRHRAVFVAAMNAVLRSLGAAEGTMHCKDEDPQRCGPEIARELQARFGRKRVGLVGLQPAILKGLVDRFGSEFVRVLDLNPENIGTSKCGVLIWDGETDLPRLAEWCEVALATGSSLVNGTLDEIKQDFEAVGKPLVFFGNTISGAAALLRFDRICPFGR